MRPTTAASATTAMDNRRVRTRIAFLLVTMWIGRAAAAGVRRGLSFRDC